MQKFDDKYVLLGTNNGNIGYLDYKNMEIDKNYINAHTMRFK